MVSDDLAANYDVVAADYSAALYDELVAKPLDRALLDNLAATVAGHGPVCDLGCGPGHVAGYLNDRGVDVVGVDISPGMIAEARRRNQAIRFDIGDMRRLGFPDETFVSVVAFYSLIHFTEPDLARALGEIARVLKPGGTLLIGVHLGRDTVRFEEGFGHPVTLDFVFFEREQLAPAIEQAGLCVTFVLERSPYPGVEVETQRLYVGAGKPEQPSSEFRRDSESPTSRATHQRALSRL